MGAAHPMSLEWKKNTGILCRNNGQSLPLKAKEESMPDKKAKKFAYVQDL